MRTKKVRLYFDQGGGLTSKFNIKAVPAVVEQEGKMLKVREVAL
jgi:conjugal transfer pilus assembly protein TraW